MISESTTAPPLTTITREPLEQGTPYPAIHRATKHKALTQCWFDVVPASQTVGQH